MDPLFWLGLSILLVAVSLTAVLVVAIPALQELARAARSAEKLFDTLRRELPPTLEAIRLTGLEISDLTDEVSEGVQSAGQVVKQVDQSITGVKKQVQKAQVTTRSTIAGLRAAWKTLTRGSSNRRRPGDRLPAASRSSLIGQDYDEDGDELLEEALEVAPTQIPPPRSQTRRSLSLEPMPSASPPLPEEHLNRNETLPLASNHGDRPSVPQPTQSDVG